MTTRRAQSRPTRGRRTLRRVGATALASTFAAAGWLGLPAPVAHAASTYAAVAKTNGFLAQIMNPSIPTGIAIEGGGPQAQALQDSLGLRDASAQFPYAGDTVPGLPGTGAALFGFPAPTYPFMASTNAGSPPSTLAYPGFELHAESSDFSTEATGLVGQTAFGTKSTARIDELRPGDVLASASTVADSVQIGAYATLSDVRTVATVFASSATGEVKRSTSTSIGRISVPGLDVRIPEQTPTQAGVPIPIPGVPNQDPQQFPPIPIPAGGRTLHNPDIGLQNGVFTVTELVDGKPQTYALPSEPVLEAFKAAGFTVSIQAPQQTETGIVSGAYRFAYTAPAPPPNTYYNGATDIVQGTAVVEASVDLQPELIGTTGAAPGSNAIAPGPALDVDGAGIALPSTGVLPGTVPGTGLVGGAPAALDTVQLSAAPGTPDSGADYIYLAVMAAGLLGVLAATVVRLVGVRSRWI